MTTAAESNRELGLKINRPLAATGKTVAFDEIVIMTMRDGKVARTVEYFDRAEALEAAGLSE